MCSFRASVITLIHLVRLMSTIIAWSACNVTFRTVPPRLRYNDIYYVLSVIFTVTKQQSPRFWPKYNVWQPHVYVHQQRVVRDYARRLILMLTESCIVLLWDFELALFSNSCTFSKNRSYAVMQED